jgi:hypothetical protein
VEFFRMNLLAMGVHLYCDRFFLVLHFFFRWVEVPSCGLFSLRRVFLRFYIIRLEVIIFILCILMSGHSLLCQGHSLLSRTFQGATSFDWSDKKNLVCMLYLSKFYVNGFELIFNPGIVYMPGV